MAVRGRCVVLLLSRVAAWLVRFAEVDRTGVSSTLVGVVVEGERDMVETLLRLRFVLVRATCVDVARSSPITSKPGGLRSADA